MSQLDQAKKEAKRLFNLAKQNPTNSLTINNLSTSQVVMANINGYQSWHEYEKVLKRKDFLYGKVDKNTENRQKKLILTKREYYLQDIEFNHIEYSNKNTSIVVKQEHIPIIAGHQNNKFFDKKKSWLLDSYPALFSGQTGSGKTEVLLSLAKQYIDNQEGCIYIDGKGHNLIYYKMFSYCEESNRLNDLYVLNFLHGVQNGDDSNKKHTHSIDPINPMLGNEIYFTKFFGEEIGIVIHDILKFLHFKNHLMDTQSLESILMLHNLIKWSKNEFKDVFEINKYLTSLGLIDDYTDQDLEQALENHAFLCEKAHNLIDIFKTYPQNFKFNASINVQEIFLKRKILCVLLPALEKTPQVFSILGDLFLSQLSYVEAQLQQYKIHLQNIIIDDFLYFGEEIKNIDFNKTFNNYIFGFQDLYDYQSHPLINYAIDNASTYFLMHLEGFNIPSKLKLDIFDSDLELPLKNFNKSSFQLYDLKFYLKEQREGKAVVFSKNSTKKDNMFINNEPKYYIQPITCVYFPAKKTKYINVVEHQQNYFFKVKD